MGTLSPVFCPSWHHPIESRRTWSALPGTGRMQRSRRAQRLWQRAWCAGHFSYFCTVTSARLLARQCQHGQLSRALAQRRAARLDASEELSALAAAQSGSAQCDGADLGHALTGAPSPGLMLKDLGLPVPLPPPGQPPPSKRFSPSVCCQKFLPSGRSITCLCWVMIPRCRRAGEEAPHCCRQCFAEPVTALFSKVFHQGAEQRLEQGTEKRRLPARRHR